MKHISKSQWLDFANQRADSRVLQHIRECDLCRTRALLFSAPLTQENAPSLCPKMGEVRRLYRDEVPHEGVPELMRHLGSCAVCRQYWSTLRIGDTHLSAERQRELANGPQQQTFDLLGALESFFSRKLKVWTPQVEGAALVLLGDEDVLEIRLILASPKTRYGALTLRIQGGETANALLELESRRKPVALFNGRGKILFEREEHQPGNPAPFYVGSGEGVQAAVVFERRHAFFIPGTDGFAQAVRKIREREEKQTRKEVRI